jgi:UDP-N-acetylglucosamine:LPS N-acetylglucosamine transferase
VRPVWLVLPDPFSSRLFFDTGIVDDLRARVGERLTLVLDAGEQTGHWRERASDARIVELPELTSENGSILKRVDRRLDATMGFYPLSLRQSLRHGFNRTRMKPGHSNWFLDPDRAGPLPESERLDRALTSWHYGRLRSVPPRLRERMRKDRPAVALGNTQMHSVVPFIVCARRGGLPVVGHIASWDHTVGKGIVSPHVDRYVVQNEVMRDDLVRHHAIAAERVVVTGWPQSDVFARTRPRAEYDALLAELGLDPARPVVLVAGNTPTNAPYEGRFVDRLVTWSTALPSEERPQLLFRPHPRDREWRERFASALAADGVAVQEPSYADLDLLATLLQHVDCVVCNAGTILLDALANDRPAVCVLYDEGAPEGEQHAPLNVTGKHYEEVIASNAFVRATDFGEVVSGIGRSLDQPDELAAERRRVAREVMGQVDGRAADRIVDAVIETVRPS